MKRILIIEDDRFMSNIYREKFQSEGFDVEVAEDGTKGMEKVVLGAFDAVLLDLMLTDVNGVEVLKYIRSQSTIATLPVIVLSNAYVGSMVQAAWKAGANKCLTKTSCTPNQLVEEVRSILAPNAPALPARVAAPVFPDPRLPAAAFATTVDHYQASLRLELHSSMPGLLKELRRLLQSLARSDETNRTTRLLELYRGIRPLAGGAGLAGFPLIARLASALEALVNHLRGRPQTFNASTLHTVVQAVDLLAVLAEPAATSLDELLISPLILVLDDEPISRETVCTALESAHLRALSLDDPALALKLMEENRFDLVFLDVDMPGLNGFEVCKQLHATAANVRTPVVFVTALTDFETRAQSALSGGTDLIAKPIVLIELAVKALIHLLSCHVSPAVNPGGLSEKVA